MDQRRPLQIIALAIILFVTIGQMRFIAWSFVSDRWISTMMAFIVLEAIAGITMLIMTFQSSEKALRLGWVVIFLLLLDIAMPFLGFWYIKDSEPNLSTTIVDGVEHVRLKLIDRRLDVPITLLIFTSISLFFTQKIKTHN